MIVKELLEFSGLISLNSFDEVAGEKITEVAVSELMSDVLTMDHENMLLVTGLCTDQAIRTADIMGAVAVIVTQGKQVTDTMLNIANESGMALFNTELQNFDVCQLLSKTGAFLGQ